MNRWPDRVAAYIGLANCSYRLGRLAEAEALLRDAADRFPKEGAVFNNLAQVLSERNKTEEALQAAQQAVCLGGPLKGIYLETLEEILSSILFRDCSETPEPQGDRVRSGVSFSAAREPSSNALYRHTGPQGSTAPRCAPASVRSPF